MDDRNVLEVHIGYIIHLCCCVHNTKRMSLYTEPPTGNISWHKLESFAVKRMNFLLKVLAREGDTSRLHELVCEEATVADSDCLIAGSVKDKVSHFTLRLVSQDMITNADRILETV